MRFQFFVSTLLVLTTMSLSIHEVRGIRYNKIVSTLSIDARQTALHEENVITEAVTSEEPVNYEGATMKEEEMIMVVRRTMSSIKVTSMGSKKKKPQNQQQHRHHWIPSIHEDYYGPRHHKPTHH